MHLASYPQGATLPQLCAYVQSLCTSSGGPALDAGRVQQLVQSALQLAPGVCVGNNPPGSPSLLLRPSCGRANATLRAVVLHFAGVFAEVVTEAGEEEATWKLAALQTLPCLLL